MPSVFNNEHKSTVGADSVFYGKMDSSGNLPGPKFKESENSGNLSRDYGNQWTQVIRTNQVLKKTTGKNNLLRK